MLGADFLRPEAMPIRPEQMLFLLMLCDLGWTPLAGLLEYNCTPIEEDLVRMVIENPCDILANLARDNTVRERVPEQKRNNIMY